MNAKNRSREISFFMSEPGELFWPRMQEMPANLHTRYTCGHCGTTVGPNVGFIANLADTPAVASIHICSYCTHPTYFFLDFQIPGPAYGYAVKYLPDDVSKLYDEARSCMSVSSHTSVALLCRKILMHIAVEKGAKSGQRFIEYIDYLKEKHYIPRGGKNWVDEIRKRGNEANHEIVSSTKDEAKQLLDFTGMFLRMVYKMPGSAPEASDKEP